MAPRGGGYSPEIWVVVCDWAPGGGEDRGRIVL